MEELIWHLIVCKYLHPMPLSQTYTRKIPQICINTTPEQACNQILGPVTISPYIA